VHLEPGEDPVARLTAVNLDSVESVALGVLIGRIGRLSDRRMNEICNALAVVVDCR
jgi:mRNA interferase MazF